MFLSPPQPLETGHDLQEVNKKEKERVRDITTKEQMTCKNVLVWFLVK